jgi:perosamine synthetase
MTLKGICEFVRSLYEPVDFVPLHRPILGNLEKTYLADCIDSNFVSSVGSRVTEFEERIAMFTGVRRAVATVNGTAALHVALLAVGVERDTEVITQAVTFAATANAIAYANATPAFVDVERETLGLAPNALKEFLGLHTEMRDGHCTNAKTGRRISACVPVHIYGHPCRMDEIAGICEQHRIPLVEDAAEALGSYRAGRHVGHHGKLSTLSFNGNKVITTGGGGMLITNDESLADHLKHITTTAKRPHAWEFFHDQLGFNYRLPNLNAALGCAQMEQLPTFLTEKRRIAAAYRDFFEATDIEFIEEPGGCSSNYWLNGVLFGDREKRDEFLQYSNSNGVMTRPLWNLMPDLPAFSDAPCGPIPVARDLFDRCVALPSSVPMIGEEGSDGEEE